MPRTFGNLRVGDTIRSGKSTRTIQRVTNCPTEYANVHVAFTGNNEQWCVPAVKETDSDSE